MRKFIALGVAVVALAIAAASASAGNPNTLTLAVYGDSPYGHLERGYRGVRGDAGVHHVDQRRRERAGGRPRRRHPLRQPEVHGRLRPVDLQPLDGVPRSPRLHAGRQRVERLHKAEGAAGKRLRSGSADAADAARRGPLDLLRPPRPDARPEPDAGDLAGERVRPRASRRTRSSSRTSCGSSRRRCS